MELRLIRVDRSQEPVLRALLGYYCHDMAEWFGFECNEDGTYAYPVEHAWDPGRGVHIAYLDRIPVGFALVGPADEYVDRDGVMDLREFFVVRRHRRAGMGRRLAAMVWDAYPGPWLVRVFGGNVPAVPFWRGAVGAYTGGAYREEARRDGDRDWCYFSFTSAPRRGAAPGGLKEQRR